MNMGYAKQNLLNKEKHYEKDNKRKFKSICEF